MKKISIILIILMALISCAMEPPIDEVINDDPVEDPVVEDWDADWENWSQDDFYTKIAGTWYAGYNATYDFRIDITTANLSISTFTLLIKNVASDNFQTISTLLEGNFGAVYYISATKTKTKTKTLTYTLDTVDTYTLKDISSPSDYGYDSNSFYQNDNDDWVLNSGVPGDFTYDDSHFIQINGDWILITTPDAYGYDSSDFTYRNNHWVLDIGTPSNYGYYDSHFNSNPQVIPPSTDIKWQMTTEGMKITLTTNTAIDGEITNTYTLTK